ncbi:MAG TPA: SRPBCC family protein [Acidimicrobiales bacterium]
MTTKVETSVEVEVPVSTAYNQWTQFEEFPQFMGGVQSVTQLDDQRLRWVAEIAGVRREWEAVILEQVPDQKVAWAATEGATNAGAVWFESLGTDRTLVRLSLEYEPEGLVEKVGDFLNVVQRRAEADLEKFKSFIEKKGAETGAWRGTVNEGVGIQPGVEHAEESRGDSGKAGMSPTGIVAGAAAAAAGVAAAKAMTGGGSSEQQEDVIDLDETVVVEEVEPLAPVVIETDGVLVDDLGVGPAAGSDVGLAPPVTAETAGTDDRPVI